MGVAALVLGIIALVFSIIPLLGAAAIFVAIPAALFGLGQIFWPKKKKGLAIAGLILAIIGGLISYVQFKAVESVGESMSEATKQFEADTGIVINENVSSPGSKAKFEPLKLNSLYVYSNRETEIIVSELENVSDKTVTAFRGYILQMDDFGKLAKRSQIYYKVNIPAKTKLLIAEASYGGQSQLFTAETLEELSKKLALPFNEIKYPNDAKFEHTDIKYDE